MMQGETPGCARSTSRSSLRADLRDFFHRWGCVTYELSDDAIEVIVPDAPGESQGAASSSSTSRPGAHTIRVSSWSSSTDPGGSRVRLVDARMRFPIAAPPRARANAVAPAGVAGTGCRGRADKLRSARACSQVARAVVLSRVLFRLLEELEISGGRAADPSAFAVLDLDELRRRAHRRHADDDVETSPVADDCSDFEHGRMRTPTRCTTSASATRPSAPIPRFGSASISIESRLGRATSLTQGEWRPAPASPGAAPRAKKEPERPSIPDGWLRPQPPDARTPRKQDAFPLENLQPSPAPGLLADNCGDSLPPQANHPSDESVAGAGLMGRA